MSSQKFNPDIIQITHCRTGRYECEFSNHTVSYLPEGYFGVAGTRYLPVSFSFPLKKCYDKIGETLGIDKCWYLSVTPSKLQHLFSEIYEAQGLEQIGYFKIKGIELLYHIDQLTQNKGCNFKYFDRGQIQTTKQIRNYLVTHLEERTSLEELAKEARINLSLFHSIFSQIYGDTPYGYLKKYKMNLAARDLLKSKKKIGDIAVQKRLVWKYIIFYLIVAAIQQLCVYTPKAIHTILSVFTLFIRVMIPVVLFASTFIATTKVSELIAAMYSMRIPRSVTISFAMILRFFPTFGEEIHNIYNAMRLRGITVSFRNIFTRPMLLLEAMAVPIVMRSASIAEELSAFAVTRGIDNPSERTSFVILRIKKSDIAVLALFVILLVVLFFFKYQIYGRI